ncbi:uncharacterized protein LOC102779480 [Neolamprologus brichardi]|nr:uncharacterized protein LOC102779480 [Neolamprologus brichardi]
MLGTSLGSTPTSPIPGHCPSPDCQSDGPSSVVLLHQYPPCWVTQAQCDLAQAEVELRRLQEHHETETESVKRGVERAILGARREEQRLLERVEQDHRDTQQRLDQIQRENVAAARVSQSLLDQRLCKLAELKKQIQELGQSVVKDSGPSQNPLLKEISEFLQPWEISVSLKKVNFKPSSQPNAVNFGDIRVQEQSLCLHAGGCGPQGQPCALHSQEMLCEDTNYQGSGKEKSTQGQGFISPTGRVVRKISLSNRGDLESEEEKKHSSAKMCHCEQADWESSQEDEVESVSFQPQGEDVFLAVPTVLKKWDMEDEDKINKNGKPYSPRNKRKWLTVASSRKSNLLPEQKQQHIKLSQCLSLDGQNGDKGRVGQDSNYRLLRYCNSSLTSQREPSASQSCLDLTSRGRPPSCLSQSSDEHSLGTLGDSGRAPSPTDSLDSSYTFIVSPSHDYSMNRGSLNYSCRLSKSAVDLTHKTRPLITSGPIEQGLWGTRGSNFKTSFTSTSPTLRRKLQASDMGHTFSSPSYRGQNILYQPQKQATAAGSKQPPVARSLSLSVIDGSCTTELEAKKNLFSVTDARGNVLQQVASPTAGGSDRRCRNYFDIAVNAKGLIAVSCAAERALLVFSRHGRLLQTFGGSGFGSAKDELEAPRGVTVTRLDEFLVADIRKGTLIALKLDPKTGSRLERTVVTGFHRPYLVAACLSSGMVAVSERGNETGRVPCVKVLEPGWNTVRVLGVCAGMGPVLTCPWGICIDTDGNVLVADWGEQHRILLYPAQGVGWPIITQGLSSPRGLSLLPDGQLAVSDSMHHCIKIYQYKASQD